MFSLVRRPPVLVFLRPVLCDAWRGEAGFVVVALKPTVVISSCCAVCRSCGVDC